MAGMRRSEVSALHWADVADSTDGDGMLVTVRRSKTNQEGEVNDVRFVKDGVARALRTLRTATSPEPGDRVVPLSAQMVGLRFTAAAEAAGVESRVTAHSGAGNRPARTAGRRGREVPDLYKTTARRQAASGPFREYYRGRQRPAVGDSILPPQWVVWNACRSRRMGTPTRFSGRGS